MTKRVLLPVEVLSGESVSPGIIDLLSSVEVVLLGYHELPDQTPPDQARLQFEERALSALEDIADGFESTVEIRMVFTHDQEKTFQRIASEYDVDAYIITGVAGSMENLLVSLSGDVPVDALLDFVHTVINGRPIAVTVHLASDDPAKSDEADQAALRLQQEGIETTVDVIAQESTFSTILDSVPGHDAIVMGEGGPKLASLVFGDTYERLAAESVGPVIVVRK